MGIFGGSAQDDVDLREVKDKLARLESAVAQLQAQVASLTAGAHADGAVVAAPAGAAPGGEPWLAEVRALKESGKVINAIKVYREHTGVGLKEAKDAVEGML